MKIQFLKPHTDDYGKAYQPGWVADWSEPDANAAIAKGFAKLAPEGAYPRKTSAPVFECAVPPSAPLAEEFAATGETITVDELTAGDKKKITAIGRIFK
jgi:hypothetical protein